MNKITLTINGKIFNLLVESHETLAHVIREKAGLTGTKIGCEQGSCGTCTVLANNQPVLSCITPAMRFDQAEITTIEGLDKNGELHKLQQKFVEKGATQCGFCTPGMVMTALDFVNNHSLPSVDEIKEALSGNLCRCTGYKKIIEAVAEYANEFNSGKEVNIQQSNHTSRIIGKPRPYIEAEKKVKGVAGYADDIKPKNALHCKFLRSIHAHAFIESIDASEALKLPGVHYIATGKELPVKFGVLPISQDETAMAVEKVRYLGEIVAAVAADSEEIAAQACKLIKVTYRPVKAFLEIDESLKDIGENEKIHAHCKFNNNIHKKAELRFGDQQQGLKNSAFTSKMSFQFEGVSHGFTEPHAATAWWDENGLTIITATQVPHYLHRALAKVMEVPLIFAFVSLNLYVGGGFGRNPFPHEVIHLVLARAQTPVSVGFQEKVMHHNLKTSFKAGNGNRISRIEYLQALDADIAIDGGAYGSFGVVILITVYCFRRHIN
ncbi:MAG: 2Fe-2S iron-sulfur cluster-binding protein [Bacteroidia bacterium]